MSKDFKLQCQNYMYRDIISMSTKAIPIAEDDTPYEHESVIELSRNKEGSPRTCRLFKVLEPVNHL